MEKYFTGNTGVKIPTMVYGTAWKEERTSDLVFKALKSGFRGVDTACQPKHYKESLVGDGIVKSYESGIKREDLFIQTKFTPLRGQDEKSIPYSRESALADQIWESFNVSKKNLQTTYLDSLILHSPLDTFEKTLLAWTTLEEISKTGEVKQIGISNCYNFDFFTKLYNKAKVKPSVLQNRFYRDSNYDVELRDFCHKHKIYYQCFWTLKANPHILGSEVILELMKTKGKSAAQIFFRCLNQQNIYPLSGTTSLNHMKDDLDLLSFSLTENECEQIRKCGPY